MNLNFNFSAIETLLILKGLNLIAEDSECHELDKKDAVRLKERILKEIKGDKI